MRGFPRHINTAQDVERVMGLYPEETKAFLARCLEAKDRWVNDRPAEEGEKVVESETLRVVELRAEDGESVVRMLQKLEPDPGSKLSRLGLSVEEVERVVAVDQGEVEAAVEEVAVLK